MLAASKIESFSSCSLQRLIMLCLSLGGLQMGMDMKKIGRPTIENIILILNIC